MVIWGVQIATYLRLIKQNDRKSAKKHFFKLKLILRTFLYMYSLHINFEQILTIGSTKYENWHSFPSLHIHNQESSLKLLHSFDFCAKYQECLQIFMILFIFHQKWRIADQIRESSKNAQFLDFPQLLVLDIGNYENYSKIMIFLIFHN